MPPKSKSRRLALRKPSRRIRKPVPYQESVEFRWLAANSRALEKYAGEWLLLHGEELVAHSPDFQVIRRAAKSRGIESPFVHYIPTREESHLLVI